MEAATDLAIRLGMLLLFAYTILTCAVPLAMGTGGQVADLIKSFWRRE